MPLKDAGGSEFEAKKESYKVSYLTATEVELSYPGAALKRWEKSPLILAKGRKEGGTGAEAVMGRTAVGILSAAPPSHPAQHAVQPARGELRCDPAPGHAQPSSPFYTSPWPGPISPWLAFTF